MKCYKVSNRVYYICDSETKKIEKIYYGQEKRALNYVLKTDRKLTWYSFIKDDMMNNNRLNNLMIGDIFPADIIGMI